MSTPRHHRPAPRPTDLAGPGRSAEHPTLAERSRLARLERRLGAVLGDQGRPFGPTAAAALAARAVAGAGGVAWARRLGITTARLDTLEGGWLHPARAPTRLLEVDPVTRWLDLARAAGPVDGPVPRDALGSVLDPEGACRSRHPAARRRPGADRQPADG